MKVSVLIPVYNAAPYVAQAIQSVLDQSYHDKEIIIVDDGSKDESLAIAKSFESKQLKVVSQENQGACAARNLAFQLAQGEYIQFLDADDLLSPGKIANQVNIFRQFGNNIIASCSWMYFSSGGQLPQELPQRGVLDRDWANPIDWLINAFEGHGMGQTGIWLTHRSLIEKAGPWNNELLINQDGEFFCRVLLQAQAIKYCKDAIAYYRSGTSGSITRSHSIKKGESQLHSYKLYEKHLLGRDDSFRMRHAIMMNYMSFIYHHYDNYPGLIPIARKYMKELGFNKLSIVGGKRFGMLSKLVGVGNALRIRSFARRMRPA